MTQVDATEACSAETVERDSERPLLVDGWRVETQRKVEELRSLTTLLEERQGVAGPNTELWAGIRRHLETACRAAETRDSRSRWQKLLRPADTASVDATVGGIDAAEASLLRMAPSHYVMGHLPTVLAQVNRYLPKADPRRVFVDDIAHESRKTSFELDDRTRDILVNAYHAAGSQRRRDLVRAGSFFGVLVGT